MLNFLALLGWHPSGDKEMFSREELIAEFSIDRVQQSGAVFNEEKLDWLNREHMKRMPVAEVATLAAPFFAKKGIVAQDEKLLRRVVAVQRARAKTLDDIAQTSGFFFTLPEYEPTLLIWERFFHAQRSFRNSFRRTCGDLGNRRRGFRARNIDRLPSSYCRR